MRTTNRPKRKVNGCARPRQEESSLNPHYLKLPPTKQIGKQTRSSTKFRASRRAVAGEKRASVKRTGEVGMVAEYLNTVNQGQQIPQPLAQAARYGQAQIGKPPNRRHGQYHKLNEEPPNPPLPWCLSPYCPPPNERVAAARALLARWCARNATAQMGATQRGYLNEAKADRVRPVHRSASKSRPVPALLKKIAPKYARTRCLLDHQTRRTRRQGP